MEDKRVISIDQGQKLAAEHGVPFMETSAKANINVEEAFTSIARAIKKKMDTKVVSAPATGGGSTTKVSADTGGSGGKKGCC